MARETYSDATIRLLNFLGDKGYKCSRWDLKEPHATSPSGTRVTFKPQATYLGVHSSFTDRRGMTGETLLALVAGHERDQKADKVCRGHESTDGPIGNTVYCDGSCRR